MQFYIFLGLILSLTGCHKIHHDHHHYGTHHHKVEQSLHIPIHVKQSHDHDERRHLHIETDTKVDVPLVNQNTSNKQGG